MATSAITLILALRAYCKLFPYSFLGHQECMTEDELHERGMLPCCNPIFKEKSLSFNVQVATYNPSQIGRYCIIWNKKTRIVCKISMLDPNVRSRTVSGYDYYDLEKNKRYELQIETLPSTSAAVEVLKDGAKCILKLSPFGSPTISIPFFIKEKDVNGNSVISELESYWTKLSRKLRQWLNTSKSYFVGLTYTRRYIWRERNANHEDQQTSP